MPFPQTHELNEEARSTSKGELSTKLFTGRPFGCKLRHGKAIKCRLATGPGALRAGCPIQGDSRKDERHRSGTETASTPLPMARVKDSRAANRVTGCHAQSTKNASATGA